ncbi:MAG: hypothetical protein QME40_05315 [bacterium]|nr:hypothetical protein [bacterium]
MELISFKDFEKLDLRIGRIKEVKDHPNADRLFILTIDVGGALKQTVAALKEYYTKEDLEGKQIVIVNNLQEAVVRGVKSEGMILASTGRKGCSIITTDREIEEGSPVL